MPEITETSTSNLNDDIALLTHEGEEEEKPIEAQGEEVAEVEEEDGTKPPKSKTPSKEEEEEEPAPGGAAPTFEQLKSKYPNILKEFPGLRGALARDHEFGELFDTIDQAKEIVENNTAFEGLKNNIFNGDGSGIIKAIADEDKESLDRFASNILPNLYKISPEVHWKASLPLLQNLVRNAYKGGMDDSNDNLKSAAEWVSHFLFKDKGACARGEKNVYEPPKDVPKVEPTEERKYQVQRFTDFKSDTEQDGANEIINYAKSIFEPKNERDPVNELTAWVKGKLIEDAVRLTNEAMMSDRDHTALMDKLWLNARGSNWSRDSKAKLITAFLARAKAIMPTLRAKLVSEALGKTIKASKTERVESESQNGRSPRGSESRAPSAREINWNETSDEDFLNGKFVLKKR